ncbi:MAG: hypothetical protein H6613_18065 [Ignavibacteriales bacterium]|nr:hypothetical protein [Ignavibacteriales bacterium]
MLKLQFTEKNNITNKFNSGLFLLAAVFIALSLRFYDVSNRPLHNDEAVNTIKFQSLLEQNEYKYDPIEYHGPTLYYATLVAAWVSGVSNFEDLNEKIIRGIPIFFSLLLFLAFFTLRKNLSTISLIVITLFF